jgi:hypothetical protein
MNHVGTAALGCPAEHRSARFGFRQKAGRASLDWTAGATVPTRFVVIAGRHQESTSNLRLNRPIIS